MRSFLFFLAVFFTFGSVAAPAQGGGKAEPNRIRFAVGKPGATLTGTLSNGQEMEYVFGAAKGQTVTIRNPKTSLFDFRVFNDEFEFETEFESSPTLNFEVPETGDYLFYIRKKATRPRSARFSIAITIK